MWGGVGRGKSMLMDLLYDQIAAPKDRQHFHAFMQWVHSEMAEVRKTGVDDAIKPVAAKLTDKIRFLAFDEMQITDITDAMIVGRLFEYLLSAGVVIVTTSNRPPGDLYKDGLNRQLFLPFIDLIRDRLEVHELTSEVDDRQGRLAGTPRYFSPNNAEARRQIDSVWQELTKGESHPLVLTVKNDGEMLLFGSFAGAKDDPAWAHNLRANPDIDVEVGTETFAARIEELSADDARAQCATTAANNETFAGYVESAAPREIPVFRVHRR